MQEAQDEGGNKPNVKKKPEAGQQWSEVSIWECVDTTTLSRW